MPPLELELLVEPPPFALPELPRERLDDRCPLDFAALPPLPFDFCDEPDF